MATCATCGRANADHLVFCEDCGARLAPRIAPPTPPIGVPMPPAPAEGTKCSRCGSMNAAGMRFCITCGTPLEKPAAPPAVAAPTPAPGIAPAPVAPVPVVAATALMPAPVAAPPIAPVPVAVVLDATVHVAPPPATETRVCKRCQGVSDKNAQFCRFCGAPLGEPSSPVVPVARPTLPSAAVPALVAQQMLAQAAPVAPEPKPAAKADGAAPRLDQTIVTGQSQELPGKLVVVHKDGGLGASFAIGDQLDIGRAEGECVFGDDRYLSARHARITRKDGALLLRDLGSANGVYMRLRKDVAPSVLEDQDLILLGQQVLRFEIVKDAEGGFGAAWERDTLVFGTPAAPRYARLSQRTTEGVSCDVFHLRKLETVFGRESGDVVFPDDPFMSRRHASITGDGTSFQLADLGSSNGTFLRIRAQVALQHGDEIRLGQQLLRVDTT